jgi:DNA-binding response OmpR family regulator
MKIAHCPTCRQIIPPRDLFHGQPRRRAIYEYIAAHPEGVSRAQILDHVWADDIDGGPEYPNTISVLVKAMRPVLAREGMRIVCGKGRGSVYRLAAL